MLITMQLDLINQLQFEKNIWKKWNIENEDGFSQFNISFQWYGQTNHYKTKTTKMSVWPHATNCKHCPPKTELKLFCDLVPDPDLFKFTALTHLNEEDEINQQKSHT